MKKTIYSLTLLLAIQSGTGLISSPDGVILPPVLKKEQFNTITNWIQKSQNEQAPLYNLRLSDQNRLCQTLKDLETKQKSNIQLLNVLKKTISLGTFLIVTGQMFNMVKNDFNNYTIGLTLAGLGLVIYGSQIINKSMSNHQTVINNIETFKNVNFKH